MRFSLSLLIAIALPLRATAAQTASSTPSACWRFSFGQWDPPLDWKRAGHAGDAGAVSAGIRRIRDSVFAGDSTATNSNAMFWDHTDRGLLLVLYPSWWPAGVSVTFDSTRSDGKELSGTAVAMMANGVEVPSKTRAQAFQVACNPRQR